MTQSPSVKGSRSWVCVWQQQLAHVGGLIWETFIAVDLKSRIWLDPKNRVTILSRGADHFTTVCMNPPIQWPRSQSIRLSPESCSVLVSTAITVWFTRSAGITLAAEDVVYALWSLTRLGLPVQHKASRVARRRCRICFDEHWKRANASWGDHPGQPVTRCAPGS